MCESWIWADDAFTSKKPANTNFRHFAEAIFEATKEDKPWFGIEQEYTMLEKSSLFYTKPLGWPSSGFPGGQGPYYCSVGATTCFGRAIMDAHYKSCLHAGIRVAGSNAETMPGQWEF
jgi:glutamine synthetase